MKGRSRLSVLIMASVRWYNASAHYALFLARQLRETGHIPCMFGIPGSPVMRMAKESGIDCIDSIDIRKGPASLIRGALRFRAIAADRKFQVVNPHFSSDHSFAFFSLAGINIPIVRTRGNSEPPRSNALNRFFYKKSARFYVAAARYMLPFIRDMGVEEERMRSVPLAIDAAEFARYTPAADMRKKLGIPKNRIVVTCAGRLHEVKGVRFFLQSHPLLSDRERFHYIISGEEIDVTRDSLEDTADHEGTRNLSLLPRVNDVREILSITDIGVIPSIGSEAICRVALEMFSFGIPVVGSAVNGVPEVIGEHGGVVVEPGRPGEIARGIEELASGSRYKKMKRAIHARARRNSPARFAAEYVAVFRKAIGD